MYVLEDRKSMDDTSCSSQDAGELKRERAAEVKDCMHLASRIMVRTFSRGLFYTRPTKVARQAGWLARSPPPAARAAGRPPANRHTSQP